jgi:diguanylate cyclase (GGDEF)-like protein/PAS domain S-box-containing protein
MLMLDSKKNCDQLGKGNDAALYKQLFDNLQEGYAVHEILCDEASRPIDYRFLDVNSAFEQLTGFTRDQLVGKTVLEVMPATEDFWIERYGEVAMNGLPRRFEAFSREIGRHFNIYAYSPKPGCFATLFSDISARKDMETVVEDERNLLRALIDEIPDQIFVKDKQSRFVLNNSAHIKALGAHSQAEVWGKTGHDFRLAAYADRLLADDRIVMENDKPLYNIEEPTVLPSGETGMFLVSKIPLHNSAGEITGLIGIRRDITEQKRAEEDTRRNSIIQSVLREIAETAVQAEYLNEMFAKVHQMVDRVLPTKNFFITLLDKANGELVVPYCVDETNFIPKRRALGKGLTEYVMRQGHAIHLKADALAQLHRIGDIDLRYVKVNEWLGAPLKNSTGEIFGVIALFTVGDEPPYEPQCTEVISIIAAQLSMVIERKQTEETLRESEATYFALVQNATIGIVLRDEAGFITYANNVFIRMMQADEPSELLGRPYLDFVHPDDLAGSLNRIGQNILGIGSPLREHRLVGLHGHTIFVESTGVPIAKGGRTYVMGVFQDITERKRLEEQLQYQATTDGLTGIFNRRHFMARADEELQRIQRYSGTFSMLMLDIDHFKKINDRFGHAIGDIVLKQFTGVCKKATRNTDLLGRIGGEEFAILLPETGLASAKQVAERLCKSVQDHVFSTEDGLQISLSVSIGGAQHFPDESLSELMVRSDQALYRAKKEGRNRVVVAEYTQQK